MFSFPITIAFTAGLILGIALMALAVWVNWMCAKDDHRDHGN